VVRRRAALTFALLPLLAACGSSSVGGPSGSASPGPGQAPALVQVENNTEARPQWGLQQATVVYEYLTEGGITRFSVLYMSPPSGRIGPVRSARRVTLHLAQVDGAVIVYSGASTAVRQALESSGIPHADENAAKGDLFRVGDRPVPHNLVTDGDHLRDLLQRFHTSSPLSPSVWPRTSNAPSTGTAKSTASFTVPFSDQERPSFTWDASANGWRRSEPDTGAFVDADSHAPLVAGTVIVQQVDVRETSDVEDVNGAHGLDILVSGSGPAQVFSGGREYDATWSQPSSGPAGFRLADGSAAPIAPGLVWICLVARGTTAG
jgi:Protein of unknown function (DUF3048) N-terminal domain/Protein of unknown function (DUF3048) C-terminal domain